MKVLKFLIFLAFKLNVLCLYLYLFLSDTGIDHQALLKQFEHLNHQNPDTFEPKDLDMLIKAVSAKY